MFFTFVFNKENSLAIFTLTSDLGWNSHHLANLKGKLLIDFPEAKVVDLNHEIDNFDIHEAAVYLDLCFRNFPKGTIHIVLVSSYVKQYKDHLLITKSDGHVFLSLNNGFPNFLFPKSKYLCYVNDDIDKLCTNSVVNAYTQACILLKKSIEYNFEKLNAPRIIQKGGIVKQQDVLMGQIVYIDKFQNAYTNILKEDFYEFVGSGNFTIHINRSDKIKSISTDYTDVSEGEFVAIFLDNNYLQIAINNGKAAQLLGLQKGSNISLEKDAH